MSILSKPNKVNSSKGKTVPKNKLKKLDRGNGSTSRGRSRSRPVMKTNNNKLIGVLDKITFKIRKPDVLDSNDTKDKGNQNQATSKQTDQGTSKQTDQVTANMLTAVVSALAVTANESTIPGSFPPEQTFAHSEESNLTAEKSEENKTESTETDGSEELPSICTGTSPNSNAHGNNEATLEEIPPSQIEDNAQTVEENIAAASTDTNDPTNDPSRDADVAEDGNKDPTIVFYHTSLIDIRFDKLKYDNKEDDNTVDGHSMSHCLLKDPLKSFDDQKSAGNDFKESKEQNCRSLKTEPLAKKPFIESLSLQEDCQEISSIILDLADEQVGHGKYVEPIDQKPNDENQDETPL